MRVWTRVRTTFAARTQPVAPLGRIGSETCSQVTWHRASTRSPSTPNTVAALLTLTMPKRSIAAPPGARKAVVGRRTLAAQATVVEPASERVPAAHRCTGGFGAEDCEGACFVPPHPAATSAASVTVTTQFLNIPHPVISVRRTSYYIEDVVTGRYRLIRLPHRHRAVSTHV